MADLALTTLLAASREDSHATVCALAAAIESAAPELEQRFTYGMLVYTVDAKWRDWIVAIGVSKASVNLRFLHGDQLEDAAGLLRAGTSTLMTIDYSPGDAVQAGLVADYVREAVAKRQG